MNPINGSPIDHKVSRPNPKVRIELLQANGGLSSVEYEVGHGSPREARELFDQLRRIAWAASDYERASSQLPADHPAIVLQENDARSEAASYFQPDEGGEA